MAKVNYPYGCTEIRGALGAVTYCRSRSGLYVKAKGRVIQKRTPDHQTLRAAFQECSTKYLTLTPEELLAWDEFARAHPLQFPVGSKGRMCGMSWFRRTNLQRRILRKKWIIQPPPRATSAYRARLWLRREADTVVGDLIPWPGGDRFAYFSKSTIAPVSRMSLPELWMKAGYATSTKPPPLLMWDLAGMGQYSGRLYGRVRLFDELGGIGPWQYRSLYLP